MIDTDPSAVVARIRDAVNRHDLDDLMDCYAAGIRGEEPTLLDRDFSGVEQLRANWEQILTGIPDLEMDLLDVVLQGDTVWAEWRWRGSRTDGTRIVRTGVIIYEVSDGKVVRLRRYMGPLQEVRTAPY